jgi:hypothetical protein
VRCVSNEQARPVEVLESLYAHFTKLFTQCQNFFLAGLVIKVLLALTRGFRKRKYIAFPIYRGLSSVFPSMHFLPSFPRSLALGRLPPLPGKSAHHVSCVCVCGGACACACGACAVVRVRVAHVWR